MHNVKGLSTTYVSHCASFILYASSVSRHRKKAGDLYCTCVASWVPPSAALPVPGSLETPQLGRPLSATSPVVTAVHTRAMEVDLTPRRCYSKKSKPCKLRVGVLSLH